MNLSKTLLALIGIGTAALAGCASEAVDESGDGADAVSAKSSNLAATITTRKLSTDPAAVCSIDLERPVVEVRGKADVTRTITKALNVPASAEDVCREWGGDSDPEEKVSLDGGYAVGANAKGLLSISIFESSYVTGAAHPNNVESRYTFDLRNGKQLSLVDILQPAALKRLTKDCVEGEGEFAGNDAEALQTCSSFFVVEREGVRVFSSGEIRLDPEGTLHPWSEVRNELKPGVARDFAKSL